MFQLQVVIKTVLTKWLKWLPDYWKEVEILLMWAKKRSNRITMKVYIR
jgi:hypothetical protein